MSYPTDRAISQVFAIDGQRRLEFTIQEFHFEQRYERSFVVEAIDSAHFDFTGDVLQRLSHYVYGRDRTASYAHPEDWWQALKARFAPSWFLRRWPVRLKVVTFDAKALLPEVRAVADRYLIAYVGELRQ